MPDFGKRADDEVRTRWIAIIETALAGDGYVYFSRDELESGQNFEQLRQCAYQAAGRSGGAVRVKTRIFPDYLRAYFYRSSGG